MEKIDKKFKLDVKTIIKIIVILYVFILCTTWAITIKFNGAPDEGMKYDICRYLFEHKTIPHGGDEEIREPIYGISYAFTPILAYMISTIFMFITSIFTNNPNVLCMSSRIVSILSLTAYTFMNIKISEKLFKGIYKWLYVVFVSLLPQVIFLGSYLNNDSFALFSISIIVYSWIIGLESDWDWKSCITMAIGIGICSLSYYNAYGYILCSIIIYFLSNWIKKIDIKTFLKKGFAIAGIAFLIGGWWFVRSFIIYDGDMLGMTISREYSERYASPGFKPSQRLTPYNRNMTLEEMLFDIGWIELSARSFVGVFGYMNIHMPEGMYTTYGIIFLVALIGLILYIIKKIIQKVINKKRIKEKVIKDKVKNREKVLFNIIMIICIIIPIVLSMYYSYFCDLQAQGRYIMPGIIPFMYFVVTGIKTIFDTFVKNNKIKCSLLTILIIFLAISPIIAYFTCIK